MTASSMAVESTAIAAPTTKVEKINYFIVVTINNYERHNLNNFLNGNSLNNNGS